MSITTHDLNQSTQYHDNRVYKGCPLDVKSTRYGDGDNDSY
jgi:hypothetical protein